MKGQEPAFPRAGYAFSDAANEFDTLPQPGMTLRAYFAARAPEEIPHWFKPVMPEYTGPAGPKLEDIDNDHDRKLAKQWMEEETFDLPPRLQWFEDERRAAEEASAAFAKICEAHRYFAWRWHYADRMVEMGECGGPQG